MADLMRYTVFGHFLRLISRGKLLPWEEQKDSPIVQKYMAVRPEKDDQNTVSSRRHSEATAADQDKEHLGSPSESASTLTASSERNVNTSIGTRMDKEKGQDLYLVEFSEGDPHVSGI